MSLVYTFDKIYFNTKILLTLYLYYNLELLNVDNWYSFCIYLCYFWLSYFFISFLIFIFLLINWANFMTSLNLSHKTKQKKKKERVKQRTNKQAGKQDHCMHLFLSAPPCGCAMTGSLKLLALQYSCNNELQPGVVKLFLSGSCILSQQQNSLFFL